MTTRSQWQRRTDAGVIDTDVLIVGGGIVGLSALNHASEHSIRAHLIEANHIAYGASGRNAGYLMTGADDNYAAAVKAWGEDTARAMWDLSARSLEGLRAAGVERTPGYAPCPSCLIPASDAEREELIESHAILSAAGFDVRVIEQPADDALTASLKPDIVLEQYGDAVCNPREVCLMLARSAPTDSILETTQLEALDADAEAVTVTTSGPVFRAQRVLLATNAYTHALAPQLAGLIQPNRAQMLAVDARPGTHELTRAYYMDRGSEYIRQHGSRILVGGWRKHDEANERTLDDAVSDSIQAGLERFAGTALRRAINVAERWSGPMGFTPDHRPIVGPIDHLLQNTTAPADNRVWLCAGFTGHGMSLGYETARTAIDAMQGHSTDDTLWNAIRADRFTPQTAPQH